LWTYADASARLVFGTEPEDPLIALVLAKLQEAGPAGLTRTGLHNAFSRNIPAAKLVEALAKLRDRGDAHTEKEQTGRPGAPAERWFARRKNEENETNLAREHAETVADIHPVNSFVRRPPGAAAGEGEEVVNV